MVLHGGPEGGIEGAAMGEQGIPAPLPAIAFHELPRYHKYHTV